MPRRQAPNPKTLPTPALASPVFDVRITSSLFVLLASKAVARNEIAQFCNTHLVLSRPWRAIDGPASDLSARRSRAEISNNSHYAMEQIMCKCGFFSSFLLFCRVVFSFLHFRFHVKTFFFVYSHRKDLDVPKRRSSAFKLEIYLTYIQSKKIFQPLNYGLVYQVLKRFSLFAIVVYGLPNIRMIQKHKVVYLLYVY